MFPSQDWTKVAVTSTSKAQVFLYKMLQKMFPNYQVTINARPEGFIYPSTGHHMRLDVYLPELNLAFDYRGKIYCIDCIVLRFLGAQHYQEVYKGRLKEQQRRDAEKLQICTDNGLSLVVVPYWWDLSKESLVDMVMPNSSNI
jgi:hypothetical protein